MKPLRIVMRNFGPYGDEQVIDFTLLGDNSLFLIHGPTGAGKSSILDAVCFALYGSPSGNGRNSKGNKSFSRNRTSSNNTKNLNNTQPSKSNNKNKSNHKSRNRFGNSKPASNQSN